MKKLTSIALSLAMILSLTGCGDSGSSDSTAEKPASESSAAEEKNAEESKADEESEPETEAETEAPTEPLNTDVVHAEFENTVLNLSASFDVANIEGFTTTESTQTEDVYRSSGMYTYPDPEWYAAAITISYALFPISANHLEELSEKTMSYDDYDKVDLGSSYDTYLYLETGSYGDRYNLIFIGDDYLDGAVRMEFEIIPQLDSAKQEDIDLIIDTLARSLKLEGDDSSLKTADGFSVAQNGITCANTATIAGEDVDMEQTIYSNSNYISAGTTFTADGVSYKFNTLSVDDISYFGVMGGGEYADCTLAGKPGKIKVSGGIGTIEVDADIQIDDNNIFHMTMSSDSALQQGALSDAASLAEKFEEMLSDENIAATQDMFAGYINDILASFTFPDAE